MTEPDPRPTDDATTPNAAAPPSPPGADAGRPPRPTDATTDHGTEPTTDGPGAEPAAGPAEPTTPADPQQLFGSISLAAIEADIEAMMSDKMIELDGMLAGLEQLVVKLEGEITRLEAPPDDSITP